MNISFFHEQDVIIATFSVPDLDSKLTIELNTEITKQQISRIILDLEEIKHINSGGIGGIVKCLHITREKGGGMVLINVNETVKAILNLSGMIRPTLIRIANDKESAIKLLRG
jgi:anti-anti-sigma factor